MLNTFKKRHFKETAKTKDKKDKKVKRFSLDSLKNLKIAYIPYNELLKEGFMAGLGWAFGVTVGFVLISAILAMIFQALGGLPLIGNWIASLVEATQSQLLKRTPISH